MDILLNALSDAHEHAIDHVTSMKIYISFNMADPIRHLNNQ